MEEHIDEGFRRLEQKSDQIGKKFSGLEKATYALQKDLAKYAAGTEKLIQGLPLGGRRKNEG